MSSHAIRLFGSAPLTRAVAVAALLGATFLAGPLSAQSQPTPTPSPQDAAQSQDTVRETVEQRIATLHASLQITPAQEADWANVAQTMRDNDVAMHNLVLERGALDPATIGAVDDLKWYERFAKAHVGGLRKLIVSFETLYGSMPDVQKHLADHVFKSFGHDPDRRASN
jgi:periplasmic protein CpxP/Spy